MQLRRLAVDGAFSFTPDVHRDHRGLFVSPFQEPAFTAAVGGGFSVAQTNHSSSARHVLRGIHYIATPPGQCTYVYCARGRSRDVVVDIRRSSPTFGAWDVVELDPHAFEAVYLPAGVGHAFYALEDDTVMSYMVSTSYVPERELAIYPLDPALNLPWPTDAEPILSERDATAPTLAQMRDRGLLPP